MYLCFSFIGSHIPQIAMSTQSMKEVYAFFLDFAQKMESEIPDSDPNGARLKDVLRVIQNLCLNQGKKDE